MHAITTINYGIIYLFHSMVERTVAVLYRLKSLTIRINNNRKHYAGAKQTVMCVWMCTHITIKRAWTKEREHSVCLAFHAAQKRREGEEYIE